MTDRQISIVVADDHLLVLSGIRRLIEADPKFLVVAKCFDGEQALAAIRSCLPDIAVVDLKMPKFDGLSVLRAVAAEGLSTKVMLMAAIMTDSEVDAAVENGVYGIVLKEWAAESLLNGLHSVAAGNPWLPDDLVKEAIIREKERRKFADDVSARLTRRERQIALLVADGLSSKQIAYDLELSEGTVKLHLHSVFRKLGAAKRSDVVGTVDKIRDRMEEN